MKKPFFSNIGKRPLYKSLFCLAAWLSAVVSFAQSPQWVLSQGNNMGTAGYNYFRPNDEISDTYDVNQVALTFNYFGGATITPGHVYASYFYRDDDAIVSGAFSTRTERPLFIIAKSTTDASIVAYQTAQYLSSTLNKPSSQIGNPLLTVTDMANNGANIPQFTIIPRIGSPEEYLAITYVKTGTNAGRLMYWVIKVRANDPFNTNDLDGPYYLRENNTTDKTDMGSETGSIAIAKPHNRTEQYLYLTLSGTNAGIYQFLLGSTGCNRAHTRTLLGQPEHLGRRLLLTAGFVVIPEELILLADPLLALPEAQLSVPANWKFLRTVNL